ncbi:MAG: hypothetical protein R3251_01000 [Candidatus Spechtbacterales bacterium]|nr:hypothetical protein [Candidatus Spechtbacterales bacterium]
MNYLEDPVAVKCIDWALKSKAKVGFGAVLLDEEGKILGEGRNRRSIHGENDLLGGGVDYAVHAEQASVLEAIRRGHILPGSLLHVIGVIMKGPQKGFWSMRPSEENNYFSCIRCAKMFVRLGINVAIPLPSGWHVLSAEHALESARELKRSGRKLEFTKPPIELL